MVLYEPQGATHITKKPLGLEQDPQEVKGLSGKGSWFDLASGLSVNFFFFFGGVNEFLLGREVVNSNSSK